MALVVRAHAPIMEHLGGIELLVETRSVEEQPRHLKHEAGAACITRFTRARIPRLHDVEKEAAREKLHWLFKRPCPECGRVVVARLEPREVLLNLGFGFSLSMPLNEEDLRIPDLMRRQRGAAFWEPFLDIELRPRTTLESEAGPTAGRVR